ncbi:MAG: hypothetical protein J7493_16090 [Porphyrobacter sp.]|nr:hypothetical protein [Porphyrobacter sp.]
MSDAWRDATAMMARNREVLLIVAGLFFFVPSAALGLAMGDLQELMVANPENAFEVMSAFYASWWWLILIMSIASIVGYLALLALLRDHSRPTVGEAIKIGLRGLLTAFAVAILVWLGLGILLGLLISISAVAGNSAIAVLVGAAALVLTVYVAVKVSLTGPVIAIEKIYNPIAVLSRGWQLTKGNSLRLFMFYLLLFVAYIVIATVLSVISGVLTIALGPDLGSAVNAVVSGAFSAVVSVVFVAVIAAAHRQLSGPSVASVGETFE